LTAEPCACTMGEMAPNESARHSKSEVRGGAKLNSSLFLWDPLWRLSDWLEISFMSFTSIKIYGAFHHIPFFRYTLSF